MDTNPSTTPTEQKHTPAGTCDDCGATDVELFPDEPQRITRCHACGSSAILEPRGGRAPAPTLQERDTYESRFYKELESQPEGDENYLVDSLYDPNDRFKKESKCRSTT